MIRKLFWFVVFVGGLSTLASGCAERLAPAEPAGPSAAPAATPVAEAHILATVAGSIALACEKPAAPWCRYIDAKDPALSWDPGEGELTVRTRFPETERSADLADAMCRDIAAAQFDEDGSWLGIRWVTIENNPVSELVWGYCPTPEMPRR